MSCSLGRLHHATRYSSMPFLYPCLVTSSVPTRLAMMSAIRSASPHQPLSVSPPTVIPASPPLLPDAAAPQIAARPPPVPKVEKPRPKIRSSKAALSIVRLYRRIYLTCSTSCFQTPKATIRLRALLNGPIPQLIRIGVKNKGCAGLSYNLEYVDKPGKFDEVVEQDGVRVLIDSKALFSIIGSEMDWTEDALRHVLLLVSPGSFSYSA